MTQPDVIRSARASKTKATVAGNAYRWAFPAVEQMIRYRPSVAIDFLQANATTKHFVALAVRGGGRPVKVDPSECYGGCRGTSSRSHAQPFLPTYGVWVSAS